MKNVPGKLNDPHKLTKSHSTSPNTRITGLTPNRGKQAPNRYLSSYNQIFDLGKSL